MTPNFPSFWFDSDICWGRVSSVETACDKVRQLLKSPNGIDSVDEFLDNSRESLSFPLEFASYHSGRTLREFFQEHKVLQIFLNQFKQMRFIQVLLLDLRESRSFAERYVQDLGISYDFVIQRNNDMFRFWFINCSNLPPELPNNLEKIYLTIEDIGNLIGL